jgi:DNA-binding NarL/FixJ family response regulator
MNEATNLRIVIVDDHKLMRRGLRALLDELPSVEVVAEAANGLEAVEAAHRLHPDIVIMDIAMPEMDGIEATRQIKHRQPRIRVIALSLLDEGELSNKMLEAGAVRFVPKIGGGAQLIDAIRAAAA